MKISSSLQGSALRSEFSSHLSAKSRRSGLRHSGKPTMKAPPMRDNRNNRSNTNNRGGH